MIYGQKFGRSGHSAWRHLGMQQRLIPKTFSLISVQMHKVIWRSSRSKKVPNNQYNNTRTATGMDGTLHTDFRKSETSRDIKKSF